MAINPKWIVSLKNKDYPLWAGILDAATEAGLRCLETEVIQFPTPENGNLAVVMAIATFDGPDGRDRVFRDVGDCSPASTSPQLVAASLRLASTRAKGRALRDAVNVGQTMYEELPNEDVEIGAPAGRVHSDGAVREPSSQPHGAPRAVNQPAPRAPTVSRPPAPAAGSPPAGPVVERHAAPAGELVCTTPGCGAILTRGQATVSEKKFGAPYCLSCQRALANTAALA